MQFNANNTVKEPQLFSFPASQLGL